jgi:hypothetical protein
MYDTVLQTTLNGGSEQKLTNLFQQVILNNLFDYKYVFPRKLTGAMFQHIIMQFKFK